MLHPNAFHIAPSPWSRQSVRLCVSLGCVNISELHHVTLRTLQQLPVHLE